MDVAPWTTCRAVRISPLLLTTTPAPIDSLEVAPGVLAWITTTAGATWL